MPEYQPISSAHIAAIERPRCQDCRQNRMLLPKFEAGPSRFDYPTFECRRCGRVTTVVVSSDPVRSSPRSWLASGLKPPT